MKIIVLANQKGGVTKTTTSINLAAGLGMLGMKTLIVDTDKQCNTTSFLMMNKTKQMLDGIKPSIINILVDSTYPVEKAIRKVTREDNVHLIPANADLEGIETELQKDAMWGLIFSRRREEFDELGYEIIIIDTSPGSVTLRLIAMYAADLVIAPVVDSDFSLQGVADIVGQLGKMRQLTGKNVPLKVLQAKAELWNGSLRRADTDLREQLELIFTNGQLLKTIIPHDKDPIHYAEKMGRSIIRHAPESSVAEGFIDLIEEILPYVKS